jgi:hypothetical protein
MRVLCYSVMPALGAGIHVFLSLVTASKTWMAGTSPAMTLIVRSSLHKVSVGRESVSNDPDALCLTVIKSKKSR